jgi:hypothetical protein
MQASAPVPQSRNAAPGAIPWVFSIEDFPAGWAADRLKLKPIAKAKPPATTPKKTQK